MESIAKNKRIIPVIQRKPLSFIILDIACNVQMQNHDQEELTCQLKT